MGFAIKENLQQHLPLVTACAVSGLLLFASITDIAQWINDWRLSQTITQVASLDTQDKTAEMIGAIPSLHLFGQKINQNGEVPISSLGFRVTGIVKIVAEEGNNASKAYISVSEQPSKIYQIGDSLPYGVKVYDITEDAIVLENSGRLEKLPLPRERVEFKPRELT